VKVVHGETTLGQRLKLCREALGYAQKGISEAAGGKLRSWQDYEADNKVPGSKIIAGLSRLGVNANWLLTGEGPMLLNQLSDGAEPEGPVDRGVLRDVVEVLEEVLAETGRVIAPANKAELILLLCDEITEQEGKRPGKESVARLLRLVS
jgi:transcriptional regulator with XRE-family HTH domain